MSKDGKFSGKETRIGIVVVASLFVILAVVITNRMRSDGKATASRGAGNKSKAKPRLRGGPSKASSKTGSPSAKTSAPIEGNDGGKVLAPRTLDSNEAGSWNPTSSRYRGQALGSDSTSTSTANPRQTYQHYGGRNGRPPLRPNTLRHEKDQDAYDFEPGTASLLPPRDVTTAAHQRIPNPSTRDSMQGSNRSSVSRNDLYGNPSNTQDTMSLNPSTVHRRYSHDDNNTRSWSQSYTETDPALSPYVRSSVPDDAPSHSRRRTQVDAEPAAAKIGSSTRPNKGTYIVQPGDNLWLISIKVYGTGGFFRALHAHNRHRLTVPNRLAIGDKIQTPDVSVMRNRYPELCPRVRKRRPAVPTSAARNLARSSGTTYQVEEGDTLYDIARYELGNAARWVEIYELNQSIVGQDYDYLRPGTELVLPRMPVDDARDESDDSVTRSRWGSLNF